MISLFIMSTADISRRPRIRDRWFRRFLCSIACAALLLGCPAVDLAAQPAPQEVAPEALTEGPVPLDVGWRYHPPSSTSPPPSESPDWQLLDHTYAAPGQFPPQWTGIGWFRLDLWIPPGLTGKPLALRFDQAGASEVFVDGQRVARYGYPSASAEEEVVHDPKGTPLTIDFEAPGRHSILLRYSVSAVANSSLAPWLTAYRGAGFSATLDLPERALSEIFSVRILYLTLNIGVGGLALGFAILHGAIYFFHPRHRGNLWFSLFAVCLAANGFLETALQWGQLDLFDQSLLRIVNLASAFGLVFFIVLFLLGLGRSTLPRGVPWLAASFLPCALFYLVPHLQFLFGPAFASSIIASGGFALWAGYDAWRQRVRGASVLLVSGLGWTVVILTQIFKERTSVFPEVLAFGFGFLLILGGASVFLARRIAREGRELEGLTTKLEDRVRERTTELRRSEQDALAASRAKSAFLATMSHEIRTPMNAIVGFSELLDGPSVPDRQRDMVRILKRSALSLLHLIDEVLDLSRIEAGHLQLQQRPVDIKSLMIQVVELFVPQAKQGGIELRALIDEPLPETVIGDPPRLRQVLINLLGNALKFTSEGQVTLRARPLDDRIRFEVADTGIGIPEDVRDELFEPFFQVDSSTTRRHGGAGLGLSICHRLVTSMGGDLGVDSTLGEGSTFWFEIPLVEPPAPDETVATPTSEAGDGAPAEAEVGDAAAAQ